MHIKQGNANFVYENHWNIHNTHLYQNMTVEILQVMSNIKGIDMVDLEEKIMRSGAYSTLVPVVRSKVGVVMVMIFDL